MSPLNVVTICVVAEVLPLYETEDTEDEELNDSRLPAIRENEETGM